MKNIKPDDYYNNGGYRLYHFEDELCADLEALAELIAIGEMVQLNVRCLIFVKNVSTVGIGFLQLGFCLDEPVEGCSVCSVSVLYFGQMKQVIVVKFIENVSHFYILHIENYTRVCRIFCPLFVR